MLDALGAYKNNKIQRRSFLFVCLFLRYTGLSLLWPLPLRSTGSGRAGSAAMAHGPSHSAACGIFPDRGTNPCPLHRQADSQPLRHQGSPPILLFIPYLLLTFSLGSFNNGYCCLRQRVFCCFFFFAVRGLLTIVASPVAEHGLRMRRLSGPAAPWHVGSSQTGA